MSEMRKVLREFEILHGARERPEREHERMEIV